MQMNLLYPILKDVLVPMLSNVDKNFVIVCDMAHDTEVDCGANDPLFSLITGILHVLMLTYTIGM